LGFLKVDAEETGTKERELLTFFHEKNVTWKILLEYAEVEKQPAQAVRKE